MEWEAPCGARAGCLARIRPGGPGQPSGPTMRACLQWLDVTRTRDGESRPGRVVQLLPVAASGSTAPGQKSPPMERREAPAFSKGSAARRKDPVRRSALHPLALRRGEEKEANPAPQRIRAADACPGAYRASLAAASGCSSPRKRDQRKAAAVVNNLNADSAWHEPHASNAASSPATTMVRQAGKGIKCQAGRGYKRNPSRASAVSLPPGEFIMVIGIAHLQPIVALVAGILILVIPRLLNIIVAVYLIIVGILGLGFPLSPYPRIPGLRRRVGGVFRANAVPPPFHDPWPNEDPLAPAQSAKKPLPARL